MGDGLVERYGMLVWEKDGSMFEEVGTRGGKNWRKEFEGGKG